MRINYVLIDFENVQVKSLALLEGEHFRVRVFLGPKNTKLPVELVMAVQKMGNKAEYTILEASGSNALDFHIAFYLGILSAADPTAYFHIISKDTGFDPLIQHLKTKGIFSSRSVSIEDMPCFAIKEANGEKTAPTEPPKIKPKEAPVISAAGVDKNFKLIQEDLIRRKASKPRRVKTLKSTIKARCGKDVSSSIVDTVFKKLVKKGYVKIEGEKVTYALPEL
jgi:hypothetical protein